MTGLWAPWRSDQTVGNVLHRHALPPTPERKRTTTWPAFIRIHLALLAGTDFFTAEGLTLRGVGNYYVLVFIPLESRRGGVARVTRSGESRVGEECRSRWSPDHLKKK